MDPDNSARQNTYGLVFLFLFLFGPLCWLASLPFTGGIVVVGDVGAGFPGALLAALLIGLVPGFVIGVIYALLPSGWLRIITAPLIVLLPLIPMSIASATMVLDASVKDIFVEVCIVAALSAMGCAAIARVLGIDQRGAV